MDLNSFLINLGVGVTSNAIYDFIRNRFASVKYIDYGILKSELSPLLKIDNAEVTAEKIIEFLAKNGDIEIKGSKIFARRSIIYSSNSTTKFSLENSTSATDKTGIVVGSNAKILGQGGAAVKQNEDGSITFHT